MGVMSRPPAGRWRRGMSKVSLLLILLLAGGGWWASSVLADEVPARIELKAQADAQRALWRQTDQFAVTEISSPQVKGDRGTVSGREAIGLAHATVDHCQWLVLVEQDETVFDEDTKLPRRLHGAVPLAQLPEGQECNGSQAIFRAQQADDGEPAPEVHYLIEFANMLVHWVN